MYGLPLNAHPPQPVDCNGAKPIDNGRQLNAFTYAPGTTDLYTPQGSTSLAAPTGPNFSSSMTPLPPYALPQAFPPPPFAYPLPFTIPVPGQTPIPFPPPFAFGNNSAMLHPSLQAMPLPNISSERSAFKPYEMQKTEAQAQHRPQKHERDGLGPTGTRFPSATQVAGLVPPLSAVSGLSSSWNIDPTRGDPKNIPSANLTPATASAPTVAELDQLKERAKRFIILLQQHNYGLTHLLQEGLDRDHLSHLYKNVNLALETGRDDSSNSVPVPQNATSAFSSTHRHNEMKQPETTKVSAPSRSSRLELSTKVPADHATSALKPNELSALAANTHKPAVPTPLTPVAIVHQPETSKQSIQLPSHPVPGQAPVDRSDYIARLLAAKSKKSTVQTVKVAPSLKPPAMLPSGKISEISKVTSGDVKTPPDVPVDTVASSDAQIASIVERDHATGQISVRQPATSNASTGRVTLDAERKRAQTELARKRIQALTAARAAASPKPDIHGVPQLDVHMTSHASTAISNRESENGVRAAATCSKDVLVTTSQSPLTQQIPGLANGTDPRIDQTTPNTIKPFPVNSLSSSHDVFVSSSNVRKRPVATDFDNHLHQGAKRRPFGQESHQKDDLPCIIEASDDDDDGEHESDSDDDLYEDTSQSSSHRATINAPKQPAGLSQPLSHSGQWNRTARTFPTGSITSSTPRTPTEALNIRNKEDEIEVIKRKIAELERKRKLKLLSSRDDTPTASADATSGEENDPSSGAHGSQAGRAGSPDPLEVFHPAEIGSSDVHTPHHLSGPLMTIKKPKSTLNETEHGNKAEQSSETLDRGQSTLAQSFASGATQPDDSDLSSSVASSMSISTSDSSSDDDENDIAPTTAIVDSSSESADESSTGSDAELQVEGRSSNGTEPRLGNPDSDHDALRSLNSADMEANNDAFSERNSTASSPMYEESIADQQQKSVRRSATPVSAELSKHLDSLIRPVLPRQSSEDIDMEDLYGSDHEDDSDHQLKQAEAVASGLDDNISEEGGIDFTSDEEQGEAAMQLDQRAEEHVKESATMSPKPVNAPHADTSIDDDEDYEPPDVATHEVPLNPSINLAPPAQTSVAAVSKPADTHSTPAHASPEAAQLLSFSAPDADQPTDDLLVSSNRLVYIHANAERWNEKTALPAEDTFQPYTSPLQMFKSYRYHPDYTANVQGGYRSLTYSNNIDPRTEVCPFEAAGGVCNDPHCTYQHFRSMGLTGASRATRTFCSLYLPLARRQLTSRI